MKRTRLLMPSSAGVAPTTNEQIGPRLPRTTILAAQPMTDLVDQMNADLATLGKYGRSSEAYQVLRAALVDVTEAIHAAASLELEIDVSQAAESTGLTPAAIRSHIRARALPARRVGKRLYRIKLSDLRAWSEPRENRRPALQTCD